MRSYSLYLQIVPGVLLAASPLAKGQDAKSMLKAPAVSAMDHSSATPTPSATPTEAEKRFVDAEKSTLQAAGNKLMEEIQANENDLYHRLSFLEKPSRLDPNNYGSQDEIAQWRSLLQEFKQKADTVENLYNGLGKNLDAEIKNSKVNVDPAIASRFKTILLGAFPWDTIKRKSALLTKYIDEHQKLLDFYQKNWGMWKPAGKDGKPVFTNPALTKDYDKLRDEIVSTGRDLEQQYVAMTQ